MAGEAATREEVFTGPNLVSSQPDPVTTSIDGHAPRLEVRKQRWETVLLVTLLASQAFWLGCRTLTRPKVQDVVQSRQLSLAGMDAVHRGDWEDAESLFTRAIETSATNQRARCCYAETLWRRNAAADAITQMQEAVRLSGGDPQLRVRLGEMHLAQEELEAAAHQANEAIRQNPRLASSWALRGDILAQRRDMFGALAAYHRALSYQPHFPRVQIATAQLYRETNQPQRSLVALNALADAYRPSAVPAEVFHLQGLACKDLKRYDEASEALTQAIQRSDVNADLLFELADAQWLAGDHSTAWLTLRDGLTLNPNHPGCRRLVAQFRTRPDQVIAQGPAGGENAQY